MTGLSKQLVAQAADTALTAAIMAKVRGECTHRPLTVPLTAVAEGKGAPWFGPWTRATVGVLLWRFASARGTNRGRYKRRASVAHGEQTGAGLAIQRRHLGKTQHGLADASPCYPGACTLS
jgi:hypothetical protein